MVIRRVINNNFVVIQDDSGQEQILMGCGLSFGKRVGDSVDSGAVEKVFTLATPTLFGRLGELLADIPMERMQLSDEIIALAKLELGRKLSDSIYISLTDHLNMAIERHVSGIYVKNVLLWDIKRFFPDEFSVGLKALEIVKRHEGVTLPEDEAGFIAFYIVNAEMDQTVDTTYEMTRIMQEIAHIVRETFSVAFDETSVYYYRFITHLKFFAQRLVQQTYYDDGDDDLFNLIRDKYPEAYGCVLKIGAFIRERYQHALTNEEMLYLTVHIARVVSKTSR